MNDIPSGGLTRHIAVEEEAALVHLWYSGNQAAGAELYKRHVRLIGKIAGRYRSSYPTIPYHDLFQAGVEGFMRSINPREELRFHPRSGHQLNSAALDTQIHHRQVCRPNTYAGFHGCPGW